MNRKGFNLVEFMIALAIVVFFAVLIIRIVVVFRNAVSPGQQAKIEHNRAQEIADDVVSQIEYIKDPRTGLCFAHYWGDSSHGGIAFLVLVPEDKIPPKLLKTARLKAEKE